MNAKSSWFDHLCVGNTPSQEFAMNRIDETQINDEDAFVTPLRPEWTPSASPIRQA